MNKFDLFNGRINRISFLIGFVLNLIIQICITTLLTLLLGNQAYTSNFPWSALLATLFVFLGVFYLYSLSVRRLHDFNKTGLWSLAYFTGIGGFILPLVLLIVPSTKGMNKYGNKPSSISIP